MDNFLIKRINIMSIWYPKYTMAFPVVTGYRGCQITGMTQIAQRKTFHTTVPNKGFLEF